MTSGEGPTSDKRIGKKKSPLAVPIPMRQMRMRKKYLTMNSKSENASIITVRDVAKAL